MLHNRPHRRLPAVLGATTILAAGLGLMACAGGTTTATPSATEAPEIQGSPAETQDPLAAADLDDHAGDALFVEAFMARHNDTLSESADEMGLSGDAATEFDIDVAVLHAQNAADLYEQMHSDALGMPGADSGVGEATITALDVCQNANAESAVALQNLDPDQMSAGADLLSDCGDEMTAASDIVIEITSEMGA